MATTETDTRPPQFDTLDLTTLVERPKVRIDGELFELRHPDELSIVEQLRLEKMSQRAVHLIDEMRAAAEGPSEEQQQELAAVMDKTCRLVLVAPDSVHAKLREPHRSAISRAFSVLQRASLRAAGANQDAEATPITTGVNSSPDSVASTAATRPGG